MGKARENWIDCVRGIAIILVVLGHVDPGENPLCKWISSFHMPVFFLLSGILLAKRDGYRGRALGPLLVHKAKALFYPYLTFSLLSVAYYACFGTRAFTLKILTYTLTLEGYNALWFLPSMWMAECMLLALMRSRIPDGVGTAAILLGTTAYAALQYYAIGGGAPAEAGMLFQILNGLCRAGIGMVFMMAGYQSWRFWQARGPISRGRGVLIGALCFALGFACHLLNGAPDLHYSVQHNPALYYLAALLQGGGLIALCAFGLQGCAALEFLGRNSLTIMATHYPLPVVTAAIALQRRMRTGMRYADDVIACALAIAMEVGIILVINRAAPFMLRLPGKSAAKRRRESEG